MLNSLPPMRELLEALKDDFQWRQMGLVYEELILIINNCLMELTATIESSDSKDIPDYRYFLKNFLYRANRIFHSISLLLLYGCWQEAQMLYRTFLENYVETKLFLKSRRGKAVKKLKLYELINDEKYIEKSFRKHEEYEIKNKGYALRYEDREKYKNDLIEKIEKGLDEFNLAEIEKMRNRVNNGLSWHGRKISSAFKEFGMNYELTVYNESCAFIHIRDMDPFGEWIKEDKDRYYKAWFCEILYYVYQYISNFDKVCQNKFSLLNIKNKIIDNQNILYKLMVELANFPKGVVVLIKGNHES